MDPLPEINHIPMSLLFVNAADMKVETLVLSKEQLVPIKDGLAFIVVTSGVVLPINSPTGACTISGWSCKPEPTCLLSLQDDTHISIYYHQKRTREEEEEEEEDSRKSVKLEKGADGRDTCQLMEEYGDRLVESLKTMYKGLLIRFTYRDISIDGTVTGFAIDLHRPRGRSYPRIIVKIIPEGQSVEMTHVEFTHELLKKLPPGRQLSFWGQAKIKRGDKWYSLDEILPLGVRCFTDRNLLAAHIK